MIKVKDLSKEFIMHILDGKVIEGFKNVSFELEKGRALGIRGKSGRGKSSILKCIYRTYIPRTGSIMYSSRDFGEVDLARADDHTVIEIRKSEMGFITQFLHIIPRVRAVDVVAEPLIAAGTGREEAVEKAAMLLAELGIPERLFDAYPSTFSGGEKQRINIARAVITGPRMLLMDEPTASLDDRSTATVLKVLNSMKAAGTTMIGAFHDIRLMEQLADVIYDLDENGGLK